MKIRLVAYYVVRECFRRRVFLVVPVATALFLGLYALGTARVFSTLDETIAPDALDDSTLAGSTLLGLSMFATLFLGAVLATFLTFTVVRGDAEQGLVQQLIARPLSRGTLLAGKFAGAFAVAATYVAIVFLACVGITGAIGSWWPDRIVEPTLQLVGAIAFITVLSILGSIFLSTIANGIAVLMIYGMGIISGFLTQVGEALNSDSLVSVGRAATGLLPFEALYQAGLGALTADSSGITGFVVRLGPFGGGQSLSAFNYAWFAFLFIALWAAAVVAFDRRDV